MRNQFFCAEKLIFEKCDKNTKKMIKNGKNLTIFCEKMQKN